MIKLNQHLISYLGSCALSALVLFPGLAKAQVQVSPLVIEEEAERGQARGIINVTNRSNKAFRARVYAKPFTYDENGFEALESSSNDLTPYLQFSPRELVVEPGVTRRIRMISRFPPSMDKGEYRAVIFTENLAHSQNNRGGVSMGIVPRVGVTVYVRHGDISPKLTVEEASFDDKSKQILLQVSNSGNATARPKVEWTLKQGSTTVTTGKQNEWTVIAGGERKISIGYPSDAKQLTAGQYQLTGTLLWGEEENRQSVPFSINLTVPTSTTAQSN
ncbi:P pilus assembly protein, chaperone PapD [Moorena sp. SIO3I6]|uniref:P pilus assembly protein, chaperone PapD n=1 Tax=Moorena sp. SIO3I6 TaxID=2607831 RepID=UPI0013FBE6B8|nr:P pilus assembly protein, chaperone PapD [Moorena sp. SIO3I6]NEP28465.1 P pilus assembly protein, chaperone PapD [Moorena sp. SIO3I6]